MKRMKKMNKHIALAGLVIAALAFAGSAQAVEMIVNVQFMRNGDAGASMTNLQGPVASVDDTPEWNKFTANQYINVPAGPTALIDAGGAASGITITMTGTRRADGWTPALGEIPMFSGMAYLDGGSQTQTSVFSGLSVGQEYDLYAMSGAGSTSDMRVTVNGIAVRLRGNYTADHIFDGTNDYTQFITTSVDAVGDDFVSTANTAYFANLVPDADGKLTIVVSYANTHHWDDFPCLGVSGYQLVEVFPTTPITTLTWNGGGGVEAPADGGGTWDTNPENTIWWDTAPRAWDDNNVALFGAGNGAAGDVTVEGTVKPAAITFNAAGSGNYRLLQGAAGSEINLGGKVVLVPVTANVSAEIQATITGTKGGLNKLGTGTLTLSGANTYGGATTIGGGTLLLGNSLALQNSTLNYAVAGGPIDFGALTAATFGGLTGDKSLVLENTVQVPESDPAVYGAVALSVGQNNADTEYTGNLSGGGSLIKVGTGRLTLTENAYTGDTTLTAGILQTRTADSIGTGQINFQGGTLQYSGHTTDVSGRINPIAGGQTAKIDIDSGLNVIFYTANGLTGDGGLTKLGSGLLRLNAANNYLGGTSLNAGTLRIAGISSLGSGNVTFLGGTLQLSSSFDVSGRIPTVDTGQVVMIDTMTYNVPFGSAIGGLGGLTKLGTGTLTLNAANTYGGATTIGAGTLKLANSLALQNSTLNYAAAGGSINFGALTAATFGGLTGGKNLVLANASAAPVALSVGQNNADTEYTGNLSGSGSLIKVGTGTLTLNTNGYTGDTTLTAGILQTKAAGSIGAGKIIFEGGTLQYSGHNTDVSGRINPVAEGQTAKIDTGGQDVTFGTVNGLTGNGGLSKLGAGTLTLSVANDYTGGTTLNAGTLQIAALDRLGSGNITFQGGTLQYGTGSSFDVSGRISAVALGQTARIDTGVNDVSFNTVNGLTGEGGLTKLGSGFLRLNVANDYLGDTSLNAGTLQIAGISSLGGGNVTFLGGILQLSSSEDVSGRIPTVATGRVVGIDTNGNDVPFGSAIGGLGGLTKLGLGTLTLNAANGYTGPTTVNAGTLDINAGTVVTLNVPAGTANLNSPATATTVNVSGTGLLGLGGTVGALNVTGGTVNVGSGARAATATLSAGTVVATGTNALAITNTLMLPDLIATWTPGDGDAFLASGDNIRVARTLTLTGGTLTIGPSYPTSGLVGQWTFDDATAKDSSGNGYNGTEVGSPTYSNDTHDASGQCLVLDAASSQYVKVDTGGTQSVFDGGNAMTVSAWVKGWPGDWCPFVSKHGEDGQGWQMRRSNDTNRLAWTTRGIGATDFASTDNAAGQIVSDGAWHMVTMTYDGAAKAIYIDGALNRTTAATGTIAPSASVLAFGVRDEGGFDLDTLFNGKLDDIYFYNRALSAAEVMNVFGAEPVTQLDLSTTNIVATANTALVVPLPTKLGNLTLNGGSLNIGTESATADVTMAEDFIYQWVFDGGAGDKVAITGDLTLAGAWTLKLAGSGTPAGSVEYDLFTYTGELAGFVEPTIDKDGVSWLTPTIHTAAGRIYMLFGIMGDANGDSVVDAADYIIVKQNFGMTDAEWSDGDFDMSGTVDWDDLQILMAEFGTRSVGEAPAVPEPGSVMLLMFGAAALLRRRRAA